MATEKESHGTTTQRVAEKAHETVDQVAARAATAEERIREQASAADERLREGATHARERSDELISTVTRFVRENPLTAIGLAFAAGSLFSSFTRRR